MKSKTVFILVLFALLLNIFHDLLIEQQVKTEVMNHSVLLDVSQGDNKLCDLHEIFHFTAILPLFTPLFSSTQVSVKPLFIQAISPQNILEASFKPPRA